jgi:hypothetical protein
MLPPRGDDVTDRLAEIKAEWDALRGNPRTFDSAELQDEVDWLIGEVERLRGEEGR